MAYLMVNERLDGLSIAGLISRRDSLCKTINGEIARQRRTEKSKYKQSIPPIRRDALSLPHISMTKEMEMAQIRYHAMFESNELGFTGTQEIRDGKKTALYLKIDINLDDQSREEFNLISIRDSLCKSINTIIDNRPQAKSILTPPAHKAPNMIHRLFHLTPYHNHATTLLDCMMNADYAKAFSLMDKHPEAMFQLVKQKDGSMISPFKYAIKIYDTDTWKHLFENIKNQPELYHLFEQQRAEQIKQGCLDLQPLVEAYSKYKKQFKNWADGRASDWEIKNEWANLAKKQHQLVPIHMIRKLYAHVYNKEVNPPAGMNSDEITAAFSAGKILIRKKKCDFANMTSYTPTIKCSFDTEINRLYETGKAELDQFVSQRSVCKI